MKIIKNAVVLMTLLVIAHGEGVEAKGRGPQICYRPWLNHALMNKLAKIAFAEARRKKAWVRDYRGLIAVEMESYRHNKRPIYGLRFTPFACDALGMDGGGFDIEIDRKTLEVIDSYQSMR